MSIFISSLTEIIKVTMLLKKYIRDVQDFPSKGIIFKDITPLLMEPKAVSICLDLLTEGLKGRKIDKVVGLESRGFFFGTILAQKLQVGFVPIRKPNKLPFDKRSITYTLEYGTDGLEIHQDAIQPGELILIHDDVLATGGTMNAACNLVESLGGIVVQCNFLMELTFLKGREKLKNQEIYTVLEY
jgi:adenine phosphoribosyltransferase